jgi:hypothetical protein
MRRHGYGRILGEAGIHWPQGVNALENPSANSDFFSHAKALLLCNPERDTDGARPDLAIFIHGARQPFLLRECLSRLTALSNSALNIDVVIALPVGASESLLVMRDFAIQQPRFRFRQVQYDKTLITPYMNAAADASSAPYVLFLSEDTLLPPGWDLLLPAALAAASDAAAVAPAYPRCEHPLPFSYSRCLLMRRSAFVAGLGLREEFGAEAAVRNLLLRLRDLKFKTICCPSVVVEQKPSNLNHEVEPLEACFLMNRWADYADFTACQPVDTRRPTAARASGAVEELCRMNGNAPAKSAMRDFRLVEISATDA